MSPQPGDRPADADGGWRGLVSILCGTAVPVVLLAILSWLAPEPSPARPSAPGASAAAASAPLPRARRMRAEVVAAYPHDPTALTQGLLVEHGVLYESAGVEGTSTLRRIDLATGKTLRSIRLASGAAGAGIALTPAGLIQLSRASQPIVYDPVSLAVRRRVDIAGGASAGWGLCFTGTSLVTSDGSDTLTFRHPATFAVERRLAVLRDNGTGLQNITELECVGGDVFANVGQRDVIAHIDGATGHVVERIDASRLLPDADRANAGELSGIAYDPADGLLLVTGRRWPWIYKVRLVPDVSKT